jgi:hypothetical protein
VQVEHQVSLVTQAQVVQVELVELAATQVQVEQVEHQVSLVTQVQVAHLV